MKDNLRRSARKPRQNGEDSKTSGQSRSESKEKSVSGRSRSGTREKSLPGRKRRSSYSADHSPKRRNISPVNVPTFQKVPKTYINGRPVDSYCWLCHEVTNEISCEKCPRRYHEACLAKSKLGSKYCECSNISVDGRTPEMPWTPAELKQCLEYAVQEAIKAEKKKSKKSDKDENDKFQQYFKNWPIMEANDSLNTIVDISVLIDKMNNDPPYQNTGSFFSDVKWIYHNCYIVYGANHDITKSALMLEKNFKLELLDCEACRECYLNKNKQETMRTNYFIELCHKPHPIVWAKMRSYPFWPAKCLKIHNGLADVRFFGSHDKGNIPLDQVFKYSKERPKKESSTKKFKEAVLETEYYITNYENEYSTFQYFKKRTPLDTITKKQHRKGRGKRSYESPGKRRSDDSTLEVSDENEGSSIIEPNNTVERKCFVRLDVKDVPIQDDSFNSASDKKKSSEPLTTPLLKDPIDVKVILHPMSINFSEKEDGDSSNIRSNENFVVVNSNSDNLVSYEKETNASNEHQTDDQLEDFPHTSLSLDNHPNINNFTDATPYISSENSKPPIKRNVENCSNPSTSTAGLPVINSTIGDADSQEQTADFWSPTCDTLANLLRSQSFSRHFNENLVPEAHNFSKHDGNNQQEDSEEDDEIQILPESETLSSNPRLGAITKDLALRDSLFELLLSNKPRLRQMYKQFQNVARSLYLSFSLEATESNSFANIQEIYVKFLTKVNSLETENKSLLAENQQLKEESRILNEKVKELDIQKTKKDLLRGIVNDNVCKQIKQKYEMILAEKNKKIEELEEKITVMTCDKESQTGSFLSSNDETEQIDSPIMHDFKEVSKSSCPDSFEQHEFSDIEDFNQICSNTQQQQDIETIQLQSLNSFQHSNLQFQSQSETTLETSQIFEPIAESSSDVLCERRNVRVTETTYVISSPLVAVPTQLAQVLPGQVLPGQVLPGQVLPGQVLPGQVLPAQVPSAQVPTEDDQTTESNPPKRKQRPVRKPISSKGNKGSKKNG